MSARRVEAALRSRFKGRVERDFPLWRYTTYRLGGPAALYVEPSGGDDLKALGEALAETAIDPSQFPVLALGRGSNLVVSDRGFAGVVVRLGPAFSWLGAGENPRKPRDPHTLEAGASTPLPQLANWAVRRRLSGLEFAVAIPGSVGGAVRMNAGAHGSDIAGALVSARLFELAGLELAERPASAFGFSYRNSNVSDGQVVIDARFRLTPADSNAVRQRTETYRRHRAETQPGAVQNAGSVFKNPPGDHAGRLVDAARLKGFAVGRAKVSELHANFFIAQAGAKAQDVYDLVQAVRARVEERFGLRLEPEIRFVGSFDPAPDLSELAP